MPSKIIRVATYKRKSKAEEVDRDTPLARQNLLIERAREWKGEVANEEVVAELLDEELSGSTDRRPGFQKLLKLAREKQISRIYIGITSRLFRDLPNGQSYLYDLTEVLGVEVIFGDLLVPAADPYYRRYLAQRMTDAQTASIEGSVGAKSGHEQLFKDGFKVGGKARYGYMLKRVARGRAAKGGTKYNSLIVPNPRTFPIVREIFEIYAEGKKGLKAIATEMNGRGIPGPSAWNSFGEMIYRCTACAFTTPEGTLPTPALRCPQCEAPLSMPQEVKWVHHSIYGIIQDAEWTYSGHYRANFHNARIKHGEKAGAYKGGAYLDGEYRGQKYKQVAQWRIRKDSHQPAIDPDLCQKVMERREGRRNKSKGGRRRSDQHPFPVICAECGSLYSRRGEGVIGCSGRDRKIKECLNRGITSEALYSHVAREVMKLFKGWDDPATLKRLVDENRKKRAKEIPAAVGEKEKELAAINLQMSKYFALFENEANVNEAAFVERINSLQEKKSTLEGEIAQIKTAFIVDKTPFNSSHFFEILFDKRSVLDENLLEKLTPQLRNIVSFVKIFPPITGGNKRQLDIFLKPAFEPLLKNGVPKGI